MGQIIEVKTTKVNKTLIFDLNRSVSGQEGMTFNNISEASLIPDVSGQLALKLFQQIDDIDTIFIQSNMVTINFQRNIGNDTSHVENTLQNFLFFTVKKNENWYHWGFWIYRQKTCKKT